MKHKWKKKAYRKKLYLMNDFLADIYNSYLDTRLADIYNSYLDTRSDVDSYRIKITSTEECAKCGLRKGTTRQLGFYPVIVFFDEDKVISTRKIPFVCSGIIQGAFFEKGEFML